MQFNGDEVASLSLSAAHAATLGGSAGMLAAADDDGTVCFMDTGSRKLVRALRRGHASLCSSAVFLDGST
jgi:hypothetical protein